MNKKSDLRRWLKEDWVDISRKDKSGKHPPCGRSKASDGGGYPKCRPSKKVSKDTPITSRGMSKKTKEKAVKQKREAEKKPRKDQKPHMTYHESQKKSSSEDFLLKMSKSDWFRIGLDNNWLQKEALDEETEDILNKIQNAPPLTGKNISFKMIEKIAEEVKEKIEKLINFSNSFTQYANIGSDDLEIANKFNKFSKNISEMRSLLNSLSVIEMQKYEPDLMDVPKHRDKIYNREKSIALSLTNLGIVHLDILQDLIKVQDVATVDGRVVPGLIKELRASLVRNRRTLE